MIILKLIIKLNFINDMYNNIFEKQKKRYLVQRYKNIFKLCRWYADIKKLRTAVLLY